VAHSPDSDDAFMFYALAEGKLDTGDLRYVHELSDIETLNRRALRRELEVTAVSIHAYAYLWRDYALLSSGSSMGDGYGPRLVATRPRPSDPRAALRGARIGVPGLLTTAYLALKLYQPDFEPVVLPFDRIEDAVHAGEVEVGLLIHEGQLTYAQEGFHKIEDFGETWEKETGLPLPLGLDVVRKDLGRDLAREINDALRKSIEWAYDNEEEALTYALQFGRGLKRELGRRFVKMYVSDITKDMGEPGEKALKELFSRAEAVGAVRKAPPIELIR